VIPARPFPLGLASPLSLPPRTSSVTYTPQPLYRVLEESPSQMDPRDSPLFAMSPAATNSSPARSSILSSRVVSSATRNLLTYTMSSVVDLHSQPGPPSATSTPAQASSPVPPSTPGSSGFSTFGLHRGAHRGQLLTETSNSALGLTHEDTQNGIQHQSHREDSILGPQLSVSPRSVSLRRRTHSKGLSEKAGDLDRIAPGLPPPQGPLPLPNDAPLAKTVGASRNGYIQQSQSERGVPQEAGLSKIDAKGIYPLRTVPIVLDASLSESFQS
jgi:hypothetical protein